MSSTRELLDRLLNYQPSRMVSLIEYTTKEQRDIEADEFWWRESLHGDGYDMVWLNGDAVVTHHTHHYPPTI